LTTAPGWLRRPQPKKSSIKEAASEKLRAKNCADLPRLRAEGQQTAKRADAV
jgi:hypothetical protein